MRRFFGLLAPLVLLSALLAPLPTAAQEPLTEDEFWAVIVVQLFFGGDVDAAEHSMIDNSALESGLAKLQRVGHGVIDAPPSEAYRLLRNSPSLEVLSPGDPGFDNTVGMTHFWAAEFDRSMAELAGVAEVGVNLYDAGAPGLSVPELPYAPTTGSTRQISTFFGAAADGTFGDSAYAVAGQDGLPVLYGNPFFVGAAPLPDGRWLLVIAGPFSPEWSFYVSGREGDPTEVGFFEGLAGYRTERRPAAVEPTSPETVEGTLGENPTIAGLVQWLVTGEGAAPLEETTSGATGDPDEAQTGSGAVTGTGQGDGTGAGSSGGGVGLLLVGLVGGLVLLLAVLFRKWILQMLAGLLGIGSGKGGEGTPSSQAAGGEEVTVGPVGGSAPTCRKCTTDPEGECAEHCDDCHDDEEGRCRRHCDDCHDDEEGRCRRHCDDCGDDGPCVHHCGRCDPGDGEFCDRHADAEEEFDGPALPSLYIDPDLVDPDSLYEDSTAARDNTDNWELVFGAVPSPELDMLISEALQHALDRGEQPNADGYVRLTKDDMEHARAHNYIVGDDAPEEVRDALTKIKETLLYAEIVVHEETLNGYSRPGVERFVDRSGRTRTRWEFDQKRREEAEHRGSVDPIDMEGMGPIT